MLQLVPYSKQKDESTWVRLIQEIQKSSNAWEAVYFKHPDVSSDMDYCCYHQNQFVGIFAGHLLEHSDYGKIYSIEIFALAPQSQSKGLGKEILNELWKQKDDLGALVFWTKSTEAKRFYDSIGLHFQSSHCLNRSNWESDDGTLTQTWAINSNNYHNLFEYIMTRQHAEHLLT